MIHKTLLLLLFTQLTISVFSQQFVTTEPFSEGLAPAKAENAWGYIDPKGKWVIKPRFEECKGFSQGRAAFKAGNWGYIDTKGAWLIQPQFIEVLPFSEGLAAVQDPVTRKWGYIDLQGTWAIQPRFSKVWSFRNGAARVIERDPIGYINKKGEWLIQPTYIQARDFSEGLAFVNHNGSLGWVDTTGAWVIEHPGSPFAAEIEFNDGFDFSEGMASFKDLATEKFGYLDRSGKTVIPPGFGKTRRFFNRTALVDTKGYWAIIDLKGNYLLNDRWIRIYAQDFPNELIRARPVSRKTGDLQGFGMLNLKGEWVIQPQFLEAGKYAEGLFGVYNSATGTCGYMNKKGGWKIKPAKSPKPKELDEGKYDTSN